MNTRTLAAFFIASASLLPQSIDFLPMFTAMPPERPQCEVWIEGEEYTAQDGGAVVSDSGCYGGKRWELFRTEGGGSVSYTFTVAGGNYLIAVAGQETGVSYTSPVSATLDGRTKVLGKCPNGKGWDASKATRWNFISLADLSQGEHTLSFRVAEKRAMDTRFAYRIDAVALVKEPFANVVIPAKIESGQPANVFTSAMPIVFRNISPGKARTFNYRVTDFLGNEMLSGTWRSDAELALPDLPLGYYRLLLSDEKGPLPFISFARVVDPAARQADPESPYCIDTAQSWCSRPSNHPLFPANSYEITSDLVRLLGVSMVRDRYSFNQLNPAPDEYRWENAYLTNARMLSERGIPVVSVFHDAPKWTKGPLTSLAHDLFAVYRFAKASAEQYGSMIKAWEVWNEADINFCYDGAWDMAAMQKAAYLGFKAGDPNAVVLVGSSAEVPLPRYFHVMFENGIGDHFDKFNYHIYKQVHEFAPLVASVTNVLAKYGCADKPMWITENGLRHEGPAKEDPIVPNNPNREHNAEQERMQAELLAKAMVLMQSLGVERDFFFVFPPYNETGGGKVWGMLRFDFTVKPAFAALANLTAVLSRTRYLGRYAAGDGIDAFLYAAQDGTQTLVYWTSNETRTFTVPGQTKTLTAIDIMGKRTAEDARLTAGRYPVYCTGLSGLTAVPYQSPNVSQRAKTDRDIVLRFIPGSTFAFQSKTMMRIADGGGSAEVEIFNFSDRPKTVQLENRGTGYTVSGLAAAQIAPMSSKKVPITIAVRSVDPFSICIGGTSGGLQVAPFSVPIFIDIKKSDSLTARRLSMNDVSRWRKNAAGEMTIEHDAGEQAMHFSVRFVPNTDFWVYPEFLLDMPKESFANAVGVSFEVKADAVGSKGFTTTLFMAVTENVKETGKSVYFPYPAMTTEWQTVTIHFKAESPGDFDPSQVKIIRIGCNPKQENFGYRVRNLTVYYRK